MGTSSVVSPTLATDARTPVWLRSPDRWLPLLATVTAAAVIVARRPDVLIHAQFWAEDGRVYYQDVYNLGVTHTLLLPQAGYFVTFTVLAAWVARFFPLQDAPFVMALLALAVQALPVGLLFSRRADGLTPDLRIRAVLALAFLVLPNSLELDATAVNAQWNLVIAALIVLLMAPPRTARWRVLDGAILLLTGLTGPFALLLAPVALSRRLLCGRKYVPDWEVGLLVLCALVQGISLLFIAPHDIHNPGVEQRTHPTLGATPALLAKLVGGRLVIGTVLGQSTGLGAPLVLQWIALVAAAVLLGLAIRSRHAALLCFLFVAGGLLAGALLSPQTPSPAWPILALTPPQRYFIVPELAWLTLLAWAALALRPKLIRVVPGVAVVVAIVVAVIGWSFPADPPTGFAAAARAFPRAAPGTAVTLPIDPPSWAMTLVRR